MCGIAGIFDLRGEREPDRAALRRMTDAIANRGPDGQGAHLEPGLALGHRRLAIIDPGAGAQPFTSQGGRTVVTFNGEIYNHARLAPEVERAGRTLRTRCDTEVLAELIDLRGTDALDAMQGMFAFAAWNPRERTLILARDRFGEKPLYYAETQDGFLVFASEMGAMTASGLVQPVIAPEAVADYLFYGYVPDPDTIYAGVRRLPAGHTLTARRGQPCPAPRRWFGLVQAPEGDVSLEDSAAATLDALDRAVDRQREADVPLGAFLSGGVDSAGIVSSLAQAGGDRAGGDTVTCTMGFEADSHDERSPAARIAERFGTRHHEDVARLDVESLLPRIAQVYGEPFADSSALPTYLLCRAARDHVVVALSGDGADEMFAGYDRYGAIAKEALVRRALPGPLRAATFGQAGRVYPKLDWAPRHLRLRTTLQALGESASTAYARAVSAVLPDACRAILAPGLRDIRPERHVEAAWAAADTDDALVAAQATDIATWLPGRMLVKVDRASMAHGLEVRAPYLDADLAAHAASLPRAARCAEGIGKRALKAALSERLSEETLYKPKQGFDAPTDAWFRQDGGALSETLLALTSWQDSGLFDTDAVAAMAQAHTRGQGRHGQALWSVLMFDAFLEVA